MDRKWTYLMFAAGAVILAAVLVKIGDYAWSFYGTRPNANLIMLVAIVVSGAAALVALRNERLFTLATEVTTELGKVTWPTRKETFAATIVVIVTVIVASVILGIFDFLWAWLTGMLLGG
jgi:preprotein translocase subunit SecE